MSAGIVSALPASGSEPLDIVGPITEAPSVDQWKPFESVMALLDSTAEPVVPKTSLPAPEPAETVPTVEPQPPQTVAEPVGLAIPSIGVVAPVVPTGLTDTREMEVPDVDESGWYRYGVAPGAPAGSAVIAAHVDFNGKAGIFRDLRDVQLGDEIIATDAEGTARTFVVSERYQVDKNDVSTQELFRRSGPPMLTLVTCGGAFEPGDRTYTDNIVVRAAPV